MYLPVLFLLMSSYFYHAEKEAALTCDNALFYLPSSKCVSDCKVSKHLIGRKEKQDQICYCSSSHSPFLSGKGQHELPPVSWGADAQIIQKWRHSQDWSLFFPSLHHSEVLCLWCWNDLLNQWCAKLHMYAERVKVMILYGYNIQQKCQGKYSIAV